MEILSDMEMLHTDQNGRRLTPNSAVNGINDTAKAMEALHHSLNGENASERKGQIGLHLRML